MPEGVEQPQPPEQAGPTGTPLDGVLPPDAASVLQPSLSKEGEASSPDQNLQSSGKKKILLIILAASGTFFLFYLFFAFYLIASLPHPEGTGGGLTVIGNILYGTVSILSLIAVILLGLRMLRGGVSPDELPRVLMRPGVAVLFIVSLSVFVLMQINGTIPLSVDILEPGNIQGLTAPITVTLGTDSLRHILHNQGLSPRQYKWDFNGDGHIDAETQEHNVTTIYKRKGIYGIKVKILLSDGSVREAGARLTIPNAVFSIEPESPVMLENVNFDASNLVDDPEKIETIEWDFNGDGTIDLASPAITVSHSFAEIGTFQAQAIIQYKGGLREISSRMITAAEERKQPFEISIQAEWSTHYSAPLGVLFRAELGEGVQARSIDWRIVDVNREQNERSGVRESGERISHIFEQPGNFRVILSVTDNRGRIATKSTIVEVLEPLEVKDIVISGSPKPSSRKAEGIAPLDVRLIATTSTPFITFSWEQENASMVYSTDGEFHALYEDAGTFPVVLIAKDERGRTQKTPIEILVLPPKSHVAFSAVPPTGTAPLSVTFDASESFVPDGRITGFAWTFGDAKEREEKPQLLGSKVTHKYDKEGTFTVIVRALTEDSRSFEARKTIVVRSPTLNACVFPSRTTGAAPMGVRFDASCSTGTIEKYIWTFGDGATSEQPTSTQDHVFETPGVYTVLLDITDGLRNFDQTTITITVNAQ